MLRRLWRYRKAAACTVNPEAPARAKYGLSPTHWLKHAAGTHDDKMTPQDLHLRGQCRLLVGVWGVRTRIHYTPSPGLKCAVETVRLKYCGRIFLTRTGAPIALVCTHMNACMLSAQHLPGTAFLPSDSYCRFLISPPLRAGAGGGGGCYRHTMQHPVHASQAKT